MTTLHSETVVCPSCKKEFKAYFYPSICTWLNPDLIQEIYNYGYHVKCLNCGHKVPVVSSILINAPSGMFMLNTGQELGAIRLALESSGIIDREGKVLSMLEQQQLRKKKSIADFYV